MNEWTMKNTTCSILAYPIGLAAAFILLFVSCRAGAEKKSAADSIGEPVDTLGLKNAGQWGYDNPVIPGFHPDPSVCRVGDDFYLVNSTFQFFPGVPVFHSKDLIHWELIGHCLTRRSQVELGEAEAGGGIYAPTLRYHDGTFYMIVTNVTHGGNFIVTAADPAGPWSDPVWVNQDGIDPTLFWDGETCYYVGTSQGSIVLFEINPTAGEHLSDTKPIWRGTGGRWPEGPHIYKKDGWYYLLIAEGGTELAHCVTIGRSRHIEGPYEGCPDNPLLTHCSLAGQDSVIQGLGHSDIVQAADGSWWAVCLGFRWPAGSHHLLGRETFLVPVTWEQGQWPVYNGRRPLSVDMQCATLKQVPVDVPSSTMTFSSATADKPFAEGRYDLRLNFLCNPVEENYSLTAREGWLRLTAGEKNLDTAGSSTFIGVRQTAISQHVSTLIDGSGLKDGGRAGLTIYMGSRYHYDVAVVRKGGRYVAQIHYRLGAMSHVEKEIPLSGPTVQLSVEAEPDLYRFLINGSREAAMDAHFLSSETAGGFTGIYFGLFCDGTLGSTADVQFLRID